MAVRVSEMNLEVFLSPLICLLPLHWTTISNLSAIGIRTTISNVFCNESFELRTKIPNQFCNLHWTTHLQSLLHICWTTISSLVCNCDELPFLISFASALNNQFQAYFWRFIFVFQILHWTIMTYLHHYYYYNLFFLKLSEAPNPKNN